MNKIEKALKNPSYAIRVAMSQLLKINLRTKFYSHAKEYRSDTEDGNYESAVISILKNQKSFNNFKRSYSYRDVLEHVSEHHGKEYLKILETRNDGILTTAIDTVLISDNVGNPIKFKYDNYSKPLSPTTLRYLKVASDLKILFGSDLGEVVEIGCGYGGQTLINDQLLNVKSALLLDLPIVNNLIDRYLNYHLLKGAFNTTVINKMTPTHYDLVISNYAFSELPKNLQLIYIEKVLSKAKRGYLTMNSGYGGKRSYGKLSLDELRNLLPKFLVIEEEPYTNE